MSTADFYDALEPFYHLIYPDWQASIDRQGAALSEIVTRRWGGGFSSVLDATCGIGTQALGLAARGFDVRASDLSPGSIARLRNEAAARGLDIDASVCDIRRLWDHHGRQFDLVISCDNSLPHLESDDELRLALRQMFLCTRPGGGCLITIRDYANQRLQDRQLRPRGVRESDGRTYVVMQMWDGHQSHYDLTMYFIEDDGRSRPTCHAMRGRYYPVSIEHLMELMRDAGFEAVERRDGVFFQPVLLGDRPG